ncbi:3-deoxy-7-phosphoheptulonate synthase [Candidatus Daviesbacteria bacterium]|nr:3-deoxy-7-phosphoheptulonate synthase [Candidatus Daviesbacteria bacterium]
MIERQDLIKNGKFLIIAGPCAVESEEQAYSVATTLREMGVQVFRSALWKPRSSKDSFQGVGLAGLPWLRRIKEDLGMLIATEFVDKDQINPTREIVDVPWVGSRNMQNFELLKALGDETDQRPVMLKRGVASTVKEWLQSADYIGRERVILCERGVRTGTDSTRYTLDLNGALVAKHDHNMPVLADPSHAAGRRDLIPNLSLAIAASGLDGIIIEVHKNPDQALCDGPQQITPETFREVLGQIGAIHRVLNAQSDEVLMAQR